MRKMLHLVFFFIPFIILLLLWLGFWRVRRRQGFPGDGGDILVSASYGETVLKRDVSDSHFYCAVGRQALL